MNQSSTFVTAFWAGLASPVSLYSAPPLYVPQITGYSIGSSFAQVGITLNQLSVPAYYGREPDGTASAAERSAA
jgi:hypothetical protein